MDIEIQDFQTPNFVVPVSKPGLKQEGWKPAESIPLKDVGTDILDALCRNFRAEVFRKAERQDPMEAK